MGPYSVTPDPAARRGDAAKVVAFVVAAIIAVVVITMSFYVGTEPDAELRGMHAWAEERCRMEYDIEPKLDERSIHNSRQLIFESRAGGSFTYVFQANVEGKTQPMAMCDGDQYLGGRWDARTGTLETTGG